MSLGDHARDWDAPDRWIIHNEVGGYVCSRCGMPTETEPCPDHQPIAYARCNEIPTDPALDTGCEGCE